MCIFNILAVAFILLKLGMLDFYQMEANTLCYINMQIIYKLANIHMLEYVKHYDWFWGKIPNGYHTFFSLLSFYIFGRGKQ